jgi:hypothetical protein
MSMSIIAGITATKATLDVCKILNDLVNKPHIDPVEVRGKLHELLIHAVSAQAELADAQQDMFELRRQLDDRTRLEELEKDIEFIQDGGYYVRRSELDSGKHIQYCPLCWGDKGKLVPLTSDKPGAGIFRCQIHKSTYLTQAYHHAEEARRNKNINSLNARRQPKAGSIGYTPFAD